MGRSLGAQSQPSLDASPEPPRGLARQATSPKAGGVGARLRPAQCDAPQSAPFAIRRGSADSRRYASPWPESVSPGPEIASPLARPCAALAPRSPHDSAHLRTPVSDVASPPRLHLLSISAREIPTHLGDSDLQRLTNAATPPPRPPPPPPACPPARLPACPPTLLPPTRYRPPTQVLLCSLYRARPRGGAASLRQLRWRSTGCYGGKRRRGRRRRKLRKRRRPFARCLPRCPQGRGRLPYLACPTTTARVERRSPSRTVVVGGLGFRTAPARIARVVRLVFPPKQSGWWR